MMEVGPTNKSSAPSTGLVYIMGRNICCPLVKTAESGGKFAVGVIKESSHKDLQSGIFSKVMAQIEV
jgi:hypothetical protein